MLKLHISRNLEELSHYAAEWISAYIKEVLEKKERFTIALSGGNTPKKCYQLLAVAKFRKSIPWEQIHFFWGDERFVPFGDKNNNAKMAFDELLDHVPVIKENIHIIRTDIEPETSAIDYEKMLRQYFSRQLYTFDLVLLGLGDNAHTLSLFPGYDDIIFEKENWVRSFYLAEQNMHRITLTAPVINNAARVVYLISGQEKAEAIRHIMSGEHNPSVYPAQVIHPLNGELYWLLDKKAAAGLQYIP